LEEVNSGASKLERRERQALVLEVCEGAVPGGSAAGGGQGAVAGGAGSALGGAGSALGGAGAALGGAGAALGGAGASNLSMMSSAWNSMSIAMSNMMSKSAVSTHWCPPMPWPPLISTSSSLCPATALG